MRSASRAGAFGPPDSASLSIRQPVYSEIESDSRERRACLRPKPRAPMASGQLMTILEQTISAIRPVDRHAAVLADQRLNSLTKPPASLGYLEEIVRRYAAIRREGSAKKGRGALAVFV